MIAVYSLRAESMVLSLLLHLVADLASIENILIIYLLLSNYEYYNRNYAKRYHRGKLISLSRDTKIMVASTYTVKL